MRKILVCLCALAALLATGFISLTPPLPVDEMILVNKTHALSKEYVPADLTVANVRFATGTPDERKQMTATAARALEEMFAAAEKDGITLYGVSGYRSYYTQRGIYNRRLAETDLDYVSRYIAKAGESEHQTGLAMDLSDCDSRALTEAFADTEAYRWLLRRASEFGFIIRYTRGGEAQTGYGFEPWHIRYVGDAAPAIAKSGLTYEEWLDARQTLFYAQGRVPLCVRDLSDN